jgi:hypothetical protein
VTDADDRERRTTEVEECSVTLLKRESVSRISAQVVEI